MSNKKPAMLTLSEVLITIGVIGLIAAFILPSTIKDVSARIFSKQAEVFNEKLLEIANQMNQGGALIGNYTNEMFADNFTKYVKVVRRCTSDNLNECFTPQFKTANNTIDVARDLVYGKDIGRVSSTTPLVGMVMLDGTSIIAAYDPACSGFGAYDTSTDKTACMSLLYDMNGSKGPPNTIGQDIQGINASVSTCDIRLSGGLCVAAGDTSYTYDGTFVYTDGNTYNNYWAGANKACSTLGMRLPTKAELNTIYQNRATVSGLSLTSWYWSGSEYSS